jgi:hypothetical protein
MLSISTPKSTHFARQSDRRAKSLPGKIPAGQNPCRAESLPGRIPAGQNPCRAESLPGRIPAGQTIIFSFFVPTAFVPIAEGGFADYAPANIPGIYIYIKYKLIK